VALATALALMWWSTQLLGDFQVQRAVNFAIDWGQFWLIQAVFVLAGTSFAVAVRFPFLGSRFAWGRLVFAGIAILPVVYFWYALAVTGGPKFLHHVYWFMDSISQGVWPILAGVALGAGFGARRPLWSPASGDATT
jgi:hypothetical protein